MTRIITFFKMSVIVTNYELCSVPASSAKCLQILSRYLYGGSFCKNDIAIGRASMNRYENVDFAMFPIQAM